jgi:hypothetical protein
MILAGVSYGEGAWNSHFDGELGYRNCVGEGHITEVKDRI